MDALEFSACEKQYLRLSAWTHASSLVPRVELGIGDLELIVSAVSHGWIWSAGSAIISICNKLVEAILIIWPQKLVVALIEEICGVYMLPSLTNQMSKEVQCLDILALTQHLLPIVLLLDIWLKTIRLDTLLRDIRGWPAFARGTKKHMHGPLLWKGLIDTPT